MNSHRPPLAWPFAAGVAGGGRPQQKRFLVWIKKPAAQGRIPSKNGFVLNATGFFTLMRLAKHLANLLVRASKGMMAKQIRPAPSKPISWAADILRAEKGMAAGCCAACSCGVAG